MRKPAWLAVLAVVGCIGAGCESEHAVSLGPPPSTTAAAEQTGSVPTRLSLQAWFVGRDGLVPVSRTQGPTRAVATAAVSALLRGPTQSERAAGLTTAIPAVTRLLGISIRRGVATVDLTSGYQAGGSSRSLRLRLAQVVYTLTQFPTVQAVRFRLDGTPVDVISGGGVVVDRPVGRSAYASLAPGSQQLAGNWRLLPAAPLPAPASAAAAWTGRDVLVLARLRRAFVLAAYDPRSRAWRRLASPPAPLQPGPYRIAWTGRELFLWASGLFGAYRPATDRWSALPRPAGGAPSLVAWTGRELFGLVGRTALAFRPETNAWRTLSPPPFMATARAWTGQALVVVSGRRAAAFSPATGRWRHLPSLPKPRPGAAAVWDGREVLVVGGSDAPSVGFALDPSGGRWRALVPMESGRAHSAVVWTGRRLVLWGGETGARGAFAIPPHGLAYDPSADRWSPLPQAPLRGRLDPVAVWTGRAFVVWGGGGRRDGAELTLAR